MRPVSPVPLTVHVPVQPPDVSNGALGPYAVPYDRLVGTWHVVASTLPLWNNKRDVTITYSPIEGASQTTFDDLVEFRRQGAAPDSKKWSVKGIDMLETDVEGNGARWKWRGKGWLRISTSHWQLLGFSLSPLLSATAVPLGPSPTPSPDWVVTYFSSTLFTPAGLDIYARDPRGVDEDKVRALTAEIERLGGEVARLVKGGKMFRIPHGDEGEEVRTSK
ncbi:hypothetical protein DMC30DRAFT_351193 [Rhodotorula diobovata]|uniref:Uncharacterized protein n=1 Tax=Rhodotorula diobovata TaxID=5288 RepID=A0A5C5FW56_9BASI|nr:hypothetical protein DMC30DRAFT_351193 [Rhodotorula diobovata]